MTWRTDIDNIPRDPKSPVWADFGDGNIAVKTFWSSAFDRWVGKAKGQEPIAFMVLPDRYIPQDENSEIEGVAV